jgi:DNA-binding IclR family transcriptional regulator
MRISRSVPKVRSKQRARGEQKVSGTQSIGRAMEILREFATADSRGLRVVDICERLQLGWPTVHRILLCLVQEQMLMHAGDPKRYRLGPAVFQLGLAATPHFSLRELCAESLDRLAHAAGDTVFLTIRSAGNSVVIDRKEGGFQIKALPLEVGARRPLGVGAGGLAILASLQEEEARKIVEANAERLASHSDLNAASLLTMVRDARARGYALDKGHAFPEVTGIGLPIMTRSGVPIAAISVVAIRTRMTEERIASDVELLRDEIAQLETRLASSAI